MSGGSMDYLYSQVEEAHWSFRRRTPMRDAFSIHLVKVAKALKAIEWNDSGDGNPDEDQLIRDCISKTDSLNACIYNAEIALEQLRDELIEARK